MYFRNISSKPIKVPCELLSDGESYKVATGWDHVKVPPGEEFDVVMGYAVPKRTDGGARLPSIIEKKTGNWANGTLIVNVEPVDKDERQLWLQAPNANWYKGMKNDPWISLRRRDGGTEAPVYRGRLAREAEAKRDLEDREASAPTLGEAEEKSSAPTPRKRTPKKKDE